MMINTIAWLVKEIQDEDQRNQEIETNMNISAVREQWLPWMAPSDNDDQKGNVIG